MININQILEMVQVIALMACILNVAAFAIWAIICCILSIKEDRSKIKYWIIKYKVYAELDGSFCVRARSKAEAIYKFHSEFQKGNSVFIVEVKEAHNE